MKVLQHLPLPPETGRIDAPGCGTAIAFLIYHVFRQESAMALSEGDRIKLRVWHRTAIRFSEPVSDAQVELYISPVDTGLQRVWEHSLTVIPDAPTESLRDSFGNRVVQLQLSRPAVLMEIVGDSLVETTHAVSCGPESAPDPRPYEERWQEFLQFSPGVPDLAEYGSVEIPQQLSMDMDDIEFGHGLYLMARHFRDTFDYEPDMDQLRADPKLLFEAGRGSSQAMAHAMIGVLRHAGIPARFASGYVFNPKSGEMGGKLRGSGTPHAWVQAWHEGYGWIGIDPTNAELVGWQYVRTAIGRDYLDVLPCRCDCGEGIGHSFETEVLVELAKR